MKDRWLDVEFVGVSETWKRCLGGGSWDVPDMPE